MMGCSCISSKGDICSTLCQELAHRSACSKSGSRTWWRGADTKTRAGSEYGSVPDAPRVPTSAGVQLEPDAARPPPALRLRVTHLCVG